MQGSVAHPAGNYARVIEAARLDLEASGAPSFVAATVTSSWQVRTAPLVFASVTPCRSQAQALAARLEPGDIVMIVSRQVRGDRQTFCVMTPDTLATIHRSTEVIEPGIAASYLTI